MPDTGAYLLLGLFATALILGTFILSMVMRHRSLARDEELIRQLAQDDH